MRASTPAYTKHSGVGGFDFAVDPSLDALEATIFWRPEYCSSVVILAAQRQIPSSLLYAPDEWPEVRDLRVAEDGHYLISGSGRQEHRLWLPNPPPNGGRLSAIIPIDDYSTQRSEATAAFLRRLKGRASLAPRITDTRPLLMLRALDGHLAGATYREIAEHLFGRKRVEGEFWKTSTLRAVTIRLVSGGVALMRGGYRRLLRK